MFLPKLRTNFYNINSRTLRRFFFNKKPKPAPVESADDNQNTQVDSRIFFEFESQVFSPQKLKHTNIDLKTFESIGSVFAKTHPKIASKFIKEMSALYSEHNEVSFNKKEIKRLDEVNHINEKKIHAVEERIKLQIKEMEDIHDRMLKEKAKEKMFAISKFAKDLLEIIDNIERSIVTLTKEKTQISEFEKFFEIITSVQRKGEEILDKFGIKKMEGLIGDSVNLNHHDIIAAIPWPGKNNQEVIDVTQSGYFIGERVLRAAKVVVVNN
jgi:molecular chaperone GrpE